MHGVKAVMRKNITQRKQTSDDFSKLCEGGKLGGKRSLWNRGFVFTHHSLMPAIDHWPTVRSHSPDCQTGGNPHLDVQRRQKPAPHGESRRIAMSSCCKVVGKEMFCNDTTLPVAPQLLDDQKRVGPTAGCNAAGRKVCIDQQELSRSYWESLSDP